MRPKRRAKTSFNWKIELEMGEYAYVKESLYNKPNSMIVKPRAPSLTNNVLNKFMWLTIKEKPAYVYMK